MYSKVCAKALVSLTSCSYSRARELRGPVEQTTLDTFVHQAHSVTEMFALEEYKCHHCQTPGYGNRFKCEPCNVILHPICATNPTRISSFMHPQHELELSTRPDGTVCAICNHSIAEVAIFLCIRQLPQYLMHDLQPPHPLQLRPAKCTRRCDARICSSKKCEKGKWCYECKTCNVSFHITCVLRSSAKDTSFRDKELDVIIQVLKTVQHVSTLATEAIILAQS
ncbi:LOW QUALITY PROTEIN: hypothetical protein V2J09_006333 [Rumex salicifolius]